MIDLIKKINHNKKLTFLKKVLDKLFIIAYIFNYYYFLNVKSVLRGNSAVFYGA